jgi:hypothetical protein
MCRKIKIFYINSIDIFQYILINKWYYVAKKIFSEEIPLISYTIHKNIFYYVARSNEIKSIDLNNLDHHQQVFLYYDKKLNKSLNINNDSYLQIENIIFYKNFVFIVYIYAIMLATIK